MIFSPPLFICQMPLVLEKRGQHYWAFVLNQACVNPSTIACIQSAIALGHFIDIVILRYMCYVDSTKDCVQTTYKVEKTERKILLTNIYVCLTTLSLIYVLSSVKGKEK